MSHNANGGASLEPPTSTADAPLDEHPARLDMADPFEVRIRFTTQLQNLSASVTSQQKAAHYALKYKDMDEDLHSCILEQLEKDSNSMNNRANIMYFIEHLCDMASKEGHPDYLRMMQRDILRIVDAVAPEDGSGAANVKVVRRVLQSLQQKSYLLSQTVTEIDECLQSRDTLPDAMALSPDSASPGEASLASENLSKAPGAGIPRSSITSAQRPDRRQIEQRIEEDRERHKRLREDIWAIPHSDGPNVEFERMWDETSDVNEDDYDIFEQEAADRETAAMGNVEERGATHEDSPYKP